MMLKGWLIYRQKDAKQNASYIQWFIDESNKQNIDLKLIDRERLSIGMINNQKVITYEQQHINLPDFVVIRTVEPFLNTFFEACHIPTFNPSVVAHLSHHKYLAYDYMNRLNIPMVDTIFIKKEDLSDRLPFPLPFVIKDAHGRSGKHVYLISQHQQWKELLTKLPQGDFIIQSAQVKLGQDLRVFVIGKEIIAAVLRKNRSDFRANFKLGGTAEVYELNSQERSMIEKIINQFDFGLVGIDFLIHEDGQLLFNEIEDVVGSRILSATTSINLLEKYVTHIHHKLTTK